MKNSIHTFVRSLNGFVNNDAPSSVISFNGACFKDIANNKKRGHISRDT
jgi:hypothetical protein